jgi:hypothetical protein
VLPVWCASADLYETCGVTLVVHYNYHNIVNNTHSCSKHVSSGSAMRLCTISTFFHVISRLHHSLMQGAG